VLVPAAGVAITAMGVATGVAAAMAFAASGPASKVMPVVT